MVRCETDFEPFLVNFDQNNVKQREWMDFISFSQACTAFSQGTFQNIPEPRRCAEPLAWSDCGACREVNVQGIGFNGGVGQHRSTGIRPSRLVACCKQ